MSDKDTIYRQDAIDALADYIHNVDKAMGTGYLTADDCKDAAASVFEELPSAQLNLDEWCTDCKEYDSERHCCPRFNRVIRETLDEVEEQKTMQWIPCSERLPKEISDYLVTTRSGQIARYIYMDTDSSKKYWMRNVVAWMPLPKPWKGENNEID